MAMGTAVQKWDMKTRKQCQAKKTRTEAQIKTAVRREVMLRDQGCRLEYLGGCEGWLEWAHLEDKRKARTRKMAPELRHTTQGTAMLCARHHRLYDAGAFRLVFETDTGAGGAFHAE